LPGRAAALGGWLLERLAALPAAQVREVRGLGLIVGIELRSKVAPVIRALQERGVLALNAGITVLRLLPPLVIDKDALEQVAQAIEQVLADMPELSHKQTGES
jgi:acetylornithine/LysW-gamma-L-lysine aminotransferase